MAFSNLSLPPAFTGDPCRFELGRAETGGGKNRKSCDLLQNRFTRRFKYTLLKNYKMSLTTKTADERERKEATDQRFGI